MRSRKRKIERGANTLQVAPHVAALGGIKIEWRGCPALGLENRSQQKRSPAPDDGIRRSERCDTHCCGVRICRCKVEPEVERGLCHGGVISVTVPAAFL